MRFHPLMRVGTVAVLAATALLARPGQTLAVGGQNHVHSILISPRNPNDLYLGSHYRLLYSGNGGKSWKTLLPQMMLSMTLDPKHPSTMYGVTLQSGLMKSTDGGKHWKRITSGPAKGKVVGVFYDSASRTLLAYGNGMYRSTDGGSHWSFSLKGQSIANVAFGASGTAYAATGNGLAVSQDAGKRWSMVKSVGNQPVIQVAASGRTAYAAAVINMLKSTDGGRTWKALNSAPQGIEFIAASASDPNEVLGYVGGSGFTASYDGGKTWHSANSGIHDSNFSSSTVRIAPSSAKVVYTGSWGVHVYVSHDAGRHWSRVATLTH